MNPWESMAAAITQSGIDDFKSQQQLRKNERILPISKNRNQELGAQFIDSVKKLKGIGAHVEQSDNPSLWLKMIQDGMNK